MLNKFSRSVKAYDLFSQTVTWRISEHGASLGSMVGLFFTIIVVTISTYYASMRYDTLVNHGDSSVQALYR
jgi:hypothetical protein